MTLTNFLFLKIFESRFCWNQCSFHCFVSFSWVLQSSHTCVSDHGIYDFFHFLRLLHNEIAESNDLFLFSCAQSGHTWVSDWNFNEIHELLRLLHIYLAATNPVIYIFFDVVFMDPNSSYMYLCRRCNEFHANLSFYATEFLHLMIFL